MALDQNDRTLIERVDPLLGSVLDRRYQIDARIAAGGFGAIYRATHVQSGHEVALKVLHQRLATDRGVVARFRREGATMTALRSPYTIAAYELGEAEEQGILYIVMELLQGVSLFERYRATGPIPWRLMAKVARQVCYSLAEAHALGIVHRDLKPTNIHLEPIGNDPDHVKVLDFGIAKIMQDSTFDSSDLTNAGQMIGTLDYMSPEQMVGGQTTGQTDIYTLGIVMYEMIAGARPFAEMPSAAATLAAMLKNTPTPLSMRMPVPESIDRIVMRCLEREAIDRYQDVNELGRELERLLPQTEDNDATRVVLVDPADSMNSRITARTQAAIEESTVLGQAPPLRANRPSAPLFPSTNTLPGGYAPPPELRNQIERARGLKPPTMPPPIPGPPPFQQQLAQMPPVGGHEEEGPTVAMARRPTGMSVDQFGRARPPTPPPEPYPRAPGVAPHAPPPPTPQFSTNPHQFDMDRMAARDAWMSRMIWIAVIVIAVVIIAVVGSQL
ncbi:MAG: serine/threonine-protein kinase [Kofleriaceae bacterium]